MVTVPPATLLRDLPPAPATAPAEPDFPRGIPPQTLIEQVRNTLPFLWDSPPDLKAPRRDYLARLRLVPSEPLTHADYFLLCLSAHHASVASFVPTDVDNQIRYRLWHPALPAWIAATMAEAVLESADWDWMPVSTRWVRAPQSGRILDGHQGEWFSTAVAAYAANRKKNPELAAEVAARMVREVHAHAEVFEEFRQARDGIGALKSATLIAHNLGDLDRVVEQWNLPEEDPVRLSCYKISQRMPPTIGDALYQAAQLNRHSMADENHRHFALRAARPLRKSADFLLPIGPFFDDWGRKVGRHPALEPREVGQIVECLIDGWERLKKPVGYARALSGIEESFPGGVNELARLLPAKASRTLKAGPLRSLCSVSRARFEESWARNGLRRFTT